MTEFTACPGQCDAKVKIVDQYVISFCCLNCWKWHWDNGVMNTVPLTPEGAEIAKHSDGCKTRQMSRVHEQLIMDREFVVKTKRIP